MEEAGGAPLWETLEASFPSGLFPDGLEYTIKAKVRKRLRDFGWRIIFPEGDPWQVVIESFAIGGLERIHRGFGDNPWFWVVAWPSVFGAAAADFWPEIGEAAERRLVAYNAAAAHLEAILIRHALADENAVGMLPACAVRGLRAIGQSALPALPCMNLDSLALPPPGGRGARHRGRSRNYQVPALKDGDDPWQGWKTKGGKEAGRDQGRRRSRGPGDDQAGAKSEEEARDGEEAARPRSQSASRRRRSTSHGRRGLRDGVLYMSRAVRAIEAFPDGDSRGYLAPVDARELLEVLFVGEPESEDAAWAYARRARRPQDPSWPEEGWLLVEVVPREPSRRGAREAGPPQEQPEAATGSPPQADGVAQGPSEPAAAAP